WLTHPGRCGGSVLRSSPTSPHFAPIQDGSRPARSPVGSTN
ncbi:MAG: hypothetical protein AVDCRST_MAG87-2775, partial [uncultured Thermomicrobiales bacterium]